MYIKIVIVFSIFNFFSKTYSLYTMYEVYLNHYNNDNYILNTKTWFVSKNIVSSDCSITETSMN